ncbi:MAG: universal stress protein [Nitrospira sp.]|nr:universal stress protein [Nitrospira sp.]MDH4357665.1 universal stress protein [Nitrospira sp.]MDH5319931.1 universal stress protein [Nitrospira sp.]MDH5626628.1 universal stress protein [Nitrospira sp.]
MADQDSLKIDGPARVRSVFHPSDFSEASEIAFAHALKIALLRQANLDIMHVASDATAEWPDLAGVRPMLERWGLLPPGSRRTDVAALGIHVRKVMALHRDPVRAVLGYLDSHPTDLIVLATRQQEGRMRWMQTSVAQPIVQGAGEMTLFIPHGRQGFVSSQDGSISLSSILVPIAKEPPGQPALEAVRRVASELHLTGGTVTLLHVGDSGDLPMVAIPHESGWTWTSIIRAGDVVEAIVQAAEETKAGLVVMSTNGRNGFLDALRGSHSERVLSKIRCPLLNLPVGSLLG